MNAAATSTWLLRGVWMPDWNRMRLVREDLLVSDGLIAARGADLATGRPDIRRLDLDGRIIVPGFIDAHLHIESSMLSPENFALQAVRHGTTGILADPHEIANVSGAPAVQWFLDLAESLPLDLWVGIPSCVPATGMEHAGAAIGLADIRRLLAHPRAYGLAEMMNVPAILHGTGDARERVSAALDAGKLADGHCPGLSGRDLAVYAGNGRADGVARIGSDHETAGVPEAREKIEAGLFLALRYGSASRDLDVLLPGLLDAGVSLERCMLCSDDLCVRDLHAQGHVDRIVIRARDHILAHGGAGGETAALRAIALATLHPGRYLAPFLQRHGHPPVGAILPNWRANLAVLEDMESLRVSDTFHAGRRMAQAGRTTGAPPDANRPAFRGRINLGHRPRAEDFRIKAPRPDAKFARFRVIEAIPGSLLTRARVETLPVDDGILGCDPARDIACIAVFERHHASGSKTDGRVCGLGLREGAVASTVAHDSHNLIVAGFDAREMADAANCLADTGGGLAVSCGGRLTVLPLDIGGLMSSLPVADLLRRHDALIKAVERLTDGRHRNLFMTLSFLALPVIPELKITDRGLVDVSRFEIVDGFTGDFPDRYPGSSPPR